MSLLFTNTFSMYFIKVDDSVCLFFLHVSASWLLQSKLCKSAVHCVLVLASDPNPDTGYREINILCNSYRKIQQDATVYQNLLFHIYLKLNMFRATHRPSSGA